MDDYESSRGIGDENVYGDIIELVLVFSSNLYSELDLISVSASELSSNSALHYLLTT